MVNIAFVGCAHIHTPGFVKNIKKRNDVKVRKVWDPNPGRSAKWAGELGTQQVSSVADVWGDKEISAAIICSETTRHEELVLAGAAARKHLFVEKPLGMRATDSYAMADAIEKAGVIFSTGYFRRGSAVLCFLKELVDRGMFGQITRVRGSNCHSGALGDWFQAKKPEEVADDWRWMADPASAGVGAFGDLGTHILDVLLWLMGDVEQVTAVLAPGIKRYQNNGEYCDETGEGMIKFANGAIGTLAAAWDDLADPVSLQISGTEAHATVINEKLYLKSEKLGAKDDQPYTQFPPGPPAGLDAWLNAITGDTNAKLINAREAAYRAAVMEAMYEGNRTSQWLRPTTPKKR